jgi:hypothetical protein
MDAPLAEGGIVASDRTRATKPAWVIYPSVSAPFQAV